MMCVSGSYYYELTCIDEKVFNEFLIGKWKYIAYIIKAYTFHDLSFVYVVEATTSLDWEAQ
jgi:hypothetical protein